MQQVLRLLPPLTSATVVLLPGLGCVPRLRKQAQVDNQQAGPLRHYYTPAQKVHLRLPSHFISKPAARLHSGAETRGGSVLMEVNGETVEISGALGLSEEDVRRAKESGVFKQWLAHLTGPSGILTIGGAGGSRCSLKRITFQSVDMFGQRVGFVKFVAEVRDSATGAKLPGIVFARGGAVGILMLLQCQEEQGRVYALLTQQARVPVGRAILELPAGMLDDDKGDFVGTAAREVEEETGIQIKAAHLVDLTALLHASTGRKMFPSPGGSDEEITLFLHRCSVPRETIQRLQGQETGLRDHGELIQLHVVPYPDLWRSSPDSKVLAALALYEAGMRQGLVPPPPNESSFHHRHLHL
eukprot:jgi/Mesen1/8170/ME000438S07270